MTGAADFDGRWRADTATSLSTYSSQCDALDTSRDDSFVSSSDSRASSAVTAADAPDVAAAAAAGAACASSGAPLVPLFAGTYAVQHGSFCGAVMPTARPAAADAAALH
jgi:hypothetical protein